MGLETVNVRSNDAELSMAFSVPNVQSIEAVDRPTLIGHHAYYWTKVTAWSWCCFVVLPQRLS